MYSVRIYQQRTMGGNSHPHLLIRRCEPVEGKQQHRIAKGDNAYKVAVPADDHEAIARHIAAALEV